MEKLLPSINKCPLFENVSSENLLTMLKCLNASARTFGRGAFVFSAGDVPERVGVVLTGAVHIMREDYFGNRILLSIVEPGDLFGEAFACAEISELPVSAVAAADSTVLLVNYQRIVKSCTNACEFHSRLIQNMMNILANKNILLTQKLEHVTQHNTRQKLLSYISERARIAGKSKFTIPLNRQELADYLAVERSAMSAELSRMQTDGILKYHKNEFELLN
ncbi:MAG: Crp/Fnr family transcriptional regulator [Oscillospiraceae bacterium]|jgi:CRP-like cAMP-binding protein|nr:Crp/Fnr family transcriptional regulator [Oscillospiraceae bacterium]